ncbi:MAG: helix-turn-helix domain-containing protein [Candidatus Thiodiazotropha sp. (ex Ctena orbiculata)]|nr:helix-turn-helix domain-containing protein [Candidatus Thiodiazotropha taylori]
MKTTVSVAVVVIEECMASAIAGSNDMLYAANRIIQAMGKRHLPRFEWRVVSVSGRPVKTGNGMLQAADCSLKGIDQVDVVYIPGMSVIDETRLISILENNRPLVNWLTSLATGKSLITSSCTGSFFVAEAGLLDNKQATTGWPVEGLFAARYPHIQLQSSELLVAAGSIISAGASTSYQDLMLEVIQRFSNSRVAHLTARYLLLDSSRHSQAAFRVSSVRKYDDPVVTKAHELMQKNLSEPQQVPELAAHLNVSDRTLIRRFKSATGQGPIACLQKLRIDRAKWLLESTGKSHEGIANSVGYTDISSFRRLFKRTIGMTMGDYRKRFRNRRQTGRSSRLPRSRKSA